MGLQVNIDWKQIEALPVKTKAAALVGLLVLIGGLFFYFMYLPQTKALARAKVQYEKVRKEYNEKKAIADNLPSFQEEVRRLDERLEVALKKLPSTSELDRILIDVPNLAKEEELVVRSFRPGSEQQQNFYAVVPLQLELTGNYNRLARFFEKVGKLDRIITIGNVNFKPVKSKDQGTENHVEAKVSAQTYRFVDNPQNQQAPAGGRKQPPKRR